MSWCCYNVPLIAIVCLVCWGYYVYGYIYCFVYIKSLTARIILFVFFNILFIMCLWSIIASAGIKMFEVPDVFKVSQREHDLLMKYRDRERQRILEDMCFKKGVNVLTRTISGSIRYCETCQHIKPDRAHHCSSCGKCILKMDHHCPFINNCVGLANHKQFILMLFYSFLYTAYITGTEMPLAIEFIRGTIEKRPIIIHAMIGFVLATGFLVVTGAFACYHLGLVLKNETTLESMRANIFVEEGLTFDMGKCNNFKYVFGQNCLLWFLPTMEIPLGDGCVYPMRRETDVLIA